MANSFIQVETRAGEPRMVGGFTVIPMAKSLRLQFPGLRGGLIWNRPVGAVVRTTDGQEQVLPVHDPTRQVQLALLGALVGMLLLAWMLGGKKVLAR